MSAHALRPRQEDRWRDSGMKTAHGHVFTRSMQYGSGGTLAGRRMSLNRPPTGVCSPRQHSRGGEPPRNLCESRSGLRRRRGTEEAPACPKRRQLRKFLLLASGSFKLANSERVR